MSSILKALRRLEEDRARKSHIAPEIAASLLRRGMRRRQLPLWVWPAVITVVALTVASLLWSLRSAPGKVESPRQQELAPVPTKFSSPLSTGQGGVVIIEEVIDQRQPVLLSSPSPVASPALLPVQVKLALPKFVPEVTTAAETIRPVVPAIEERQSPVVSAIAWQEDSAARMAVVAGLPVMTGEMVGTAKVQEIQRDHILFTEEGILFIVRIYPQ